MQFDTIKLLFDSYVEGFRHPSNIVVVEVKNAILPGQPDQLLGGSFSSLK